jgi:hypothetical protein
MTIKRIAASALLAGATAIFSSNSFGNTPEAAEPPLPGTRLAGQGLLRYYGFDVYRARLWVPPGFEADDYAAHPLALELAYLRDFSAEAIARRSLQEMQRQQAIPAAQATRWQQALQAALPDVKKGDRLTGVYRPGVGVEFRMRGRVVGEVADAQFARLFFGIWLSPRTSEPALRQALTAPRTGPTP